MLHVIATIEVAAGRRAELLAEFHRLVPLVRAEEGCIEYGPAVDAVTPIAVQAPVRPDVLMVVEKWASLEALQAHSKAPHMAEYRQRVVGLVQRVTLQILEPA
ncbi:putative quinol monooxygenase [Fimbriiglobus ruber]|uniref:YgiN protein involved in menadione metabolism n=1 Tax=Fimbriiglobus ruber TaxID=1908690 RepID=A0A225DV16_9BACT|nr:putative quinol monooxygenase [Fimbriiglobus ruber]OWK43494.1 YgiN protein involved in menadione metabolism [Fimbriiglobus ruber]